MVSKGELSINTGWVNPKTKMSILQRIQEKRAELREQAIRTRMSAKDKMKSGWKQLKDFILVLYLLNTLIGLCQQIDLTSLQNDMMVKTVVIENPQKLDIARPASADSSADATSEKMGVFSAYTANEAETDSNPTKMASGREVYDGAIACPSQYEFGDKIKVNEKVYTCEDRMASRYRDGEYFDIYMESYDEAIKFGRKTLNYETVN